MNILIRISADSACLLLALLDFADEYFRQFDRTAKEIRKVREQLFRELLTFDTKT